jgi:hypothetical protein
MPNINIPSIDRDNALNNIIASIALQEAGLAHILNAEGEKLQKGLSFNDLNFEQLLELDKSVLSVVSSLVEFEHDLRLKLENAVNNQNPNPQPPRTGFRFIVDTSFSAADPIFGGSQNELILQIGANAGNSFTIDWGDGTPPSVSDEIGFDAARRHLFSSAGRYTVTISTENGELPGGIMFSTPDGSIGEKRIVEVQDPLLKQTSGNLQCLFSWCENLVRVVDTVFSQNPQATDLNRVFRGCRSLDSVIGSKLFEKNPAVKTFGYAFSGCLSLKGTIPEDLFKNNAAAVDFSGVFDNCPLLTGPIPPALFANNPAATDFIDTFFGCVRLTGSIPGELFKNNPAAQNMEQTFLSCEGLSGSIPDTLFSECPEIHNFSGVFRGCKGLTGQVGAALFGSNINAERFDYAFCDCFGIDAIDPAPFQANAKITNLDRAFSDMNGIHGELPALWLEANLSAASHSLTFIGCTNASNWTAVPSDWKA